MNNKDNGLLSTLVPWYNRNTHLINQMRNWTISVLFMGKLSITFTLSVKSNIDVPCMTIQKFHCLCILFSRSLFYFQLIRQKTTSQEEKRCQEQINIIYPDVAWHEIDEGNIATFLWITQKPGVLLSIVAMYFSVEACIRQDYLQTWKCLRDKCPRIHRNQALPWEDISALKYTPFQVNIFKYTIYYF